MVQNKRENLVLLVLVAAGSMAIGYLAHIVIGITLLLIILTLSYRQTIHAYPSGGARTSSPKTIWG